MSSSREEERNAGESHTEASGRVGNALFFDLGFFDRVLALYLFIILYIYVLYTFLHVLYLRFFKTILGKKLERIRVFYYPECVDKCGHCI